MAGRKSKYSSENSNTKKTKIWSVAIYIRLSQEDSDNGDEKQESNSITSQKALLNEFIEEHDDLIVYDTYVDDGYTGTDFDRPGFQKLLEDMRKGNINCVLGHARNYIRLNAVISCEQPARFAPCRIYAAAVYHRIGAGEIHILEYAHAALFRHALHHV